MIDARGQPVLSLFDPQRQRVDDIALEGARQVRQQAAHESDRRGGRTAEPGSDRNRRIQRDLDRRRVVLGRIAQALDRLPQRHLDQVGRVVSPDVAESLGRRPLGEPLPSLPGPPGVGQDRLPAEARVDVDLGQPDAHAGAFRVRDGDPRP